MSNGQVGCRFVPFLPSSFHFVLEFGAVRGGAVLGAVAAGTSFRYVPLGLSPDVFGTRIRALEMILQLKEKKGLRRE